MKQKKREINIDEFNEERESLENIKIEESEKDIEKDKLENVEEKKVWKKK